MTGLSCDGEKLCEYLDGESSPAERAQMEAHLRECATCRDELEALRSAARAMATLPRLKVSKKVVTHVHQAVAEISAERKIVSPTIFSREARSRRRGIWLTAAASVLMFATAGLVAYWSASSSRTPQTVVMQEKAKAADAGAAASRMQGAEDGEKAALLNFHPAKEDSIINSPIVTASELQEAADDIKKDVALNRNERTAGSFPDASSKPPAPPASSAPLVGQTRVAKKIDMALDAKDAEVKAVDASSAHGAVDADGAHSAPMVGGRTGEKAPLAEKSAVGGMPLAKGMRPTDTPLLESKSVISQVVFQAKDQRAAVGALGDMVRNCGGRVVAVDTARKDAAEPLAPKKGVALSDAASARPEFKKQTQTVTQEVAVAEGRRQGQGEGEGEGDEEALKRARITETGARARGDGALVPARELESKPEDKMEKPLAMIIRVPRKRAEEFIENFRTLQAQILLDETAEKIAPQPSRSPAESTYSARREKTRKSFAEEAAAESEQAVFSAEAQAQSDMTQSDDAWFELEILIRPTP